MQTHPRPWAMIWLNATACGMLGAIGLLAAFFLAKAAEAHELTLSDGRTAGFWSTVLLLGAVAHAVAIAALWRPDRTAAAWMRASVAGAAIFFAATAIVLAVLGDGLGLLPCLPSLLLAMSWLRLERYRRAAPPGG